MGKPQTVVPLSPKLPPEVITTSSPALAQWQTVLQWLQQRLSAQHVCYQQWAQSLGIVSGSELSARVTSPLAALPQASWSDPWQSKQQAKQQAQRQPQLVTASASPQQLSAHVALWGQTNSLTELIPISLSAAVPQPQTAQAKRVSSRASLAQLAQKQLNTTCPACAHHVAVPFYNGGNMPLTTLAWPTSTENAQTMPLLPHDFVSCVSCGHIYNRAFDYNEVPYCDKPYVMYNQGGLWQDHIDAMADAILARLGDAPTVVEIGCGSGHLLKRLAQKRPGGRYIGFDLNAQIHEGEGLIEAYPILFEPGVHVGEFQPDMIITRHVLEHLTNPLGFVQAIGFASACHGIAPKLFFEVPCVDRAVATGRTADFFYEHYSHFTVRSLTRLFECCQAQVDTVALGYDDEVVYGFAQFAHHAAQADTAHWATQFEQTTQQQLMQVKEALFDLATQAKRARQPVVIWGGTGKAAAFINRYGLTPDCFPWVVDSDAMKAGSFVAGTGQEIHHTPLLSSARFTQQYEGLPVIVIATQWRARDIVREITQNCVPFSHIVLEYDGQLLDYFEDTHPYKDAETAIPVGGQQAQTSLFGLGQGNSMSNPLLRPGERSGQGQINAIAAVTQTDWTISLL